MLPSLERIKEKKNYKYWVASQQAPDLTSRHDWGYMITQVFPHGEVEFKTNEGVRFKVNREQI